MSSVVIIYSGGLDSTTLLYLACEQFGAECVHTLSFDYGQRHSRELASAQAVCSNLSVSHKVIDLQSIGAIWAEKSALTSADAEMPSGEYDLENMKVTVVPNRNMLFLSVATAYALVNSCDQVWYGAHAGDHEVYPDCRPEFIAAMDQAAKLCDYNEVSVKAPFAESTKADIVAEASRLGVPVDKTWTCYEGGAQACGKCGACISRLQAFAENGLQDAIEYV